MDLTSLLATPAPTFTSSISQDSMAIDHEDPVSTMNPSLRVWENFRWLGKGTEIRSDGISSVVVADHKMCPPTKSPVSVAITLNVIGVPG